LIYYLLFAKPLDTGEHLSAKQQTTNLISDALLNPSLTTSTESHLMGTVDMLLIFYVVVVVVKTQQETRDNRDWFL